MTPTETLTSNERVKTISTYTANLSAVLVNLIGSVVFALLIPYIAIGRTLLYFDLGARESEAETAGEAVRRRWRPWPRPVTGTG